ncbi:MAG: TrbC/VirB2 family protein [Candidatus Staskawiczbacteria bacterium]
MNKKVIFSLIFINLFCLAIYPISSVSAQIKNPISSNDFGELLTKILEAVGGLIASLSTVAMAIAGIMYIASTANPELRATAKKALIYAIIGAAIGLSATAITSFIKTTVGG